MAYKFVNKGKSGMIVKVKGNPRSPTNQKKMVMWSDTKKGVQEWIAEFGTKAQMRKHVPPNFPKTKFMKSVERNPFHKTKWVGGKKMRVMKTTVSKPKKADWVRKLLPF